MTARGRSCDASSHPVSSPWTGGGSRTRRSRRPNPSARSCCCAASARSARAGTSNCRSWAGGSARLALDYRDVGDSDPATGPYTIAELADDVAGLARALDIERASLIGVSMGGFIALELALRRAALVDKLVLVVTSGGGATHVSTSPRDHAAADAGRRAGRDRRRRAARMRGGRRPRVLRAPARGDRRVRRDRAPQADAAARLTCASSRPAAPTTSPTGSTASRLPRSSCTATSTRSSPSRTEGCSPRAYREPS